MALTFGFYDSVNGDRTYTAKQFSQFFDGILSEGVFETIGDEFRVTAASGMIVNVGTGRAWLKSKWVLNDSVMPLQIAASEPILNRIDTVVFAIDEPSRTITITSVKGTPASTPSAPALTNTAEHFEYRIADVYIPATATAIITDNISNFVGTEAFPYVLMIMDTLFFSNTMPLADGTGTPGSARTYARGDHRHPTDTTRAAVDSPTFTGTPRAPKPTSGTNNTQIPTCSWVQDIAGTKAASNNAALTGTPTAPTADVGTSTTQIANCKFVSDWMALKANLASPALTGTPTAPTASVGNTNTQVANCSFVATAVANSAATKQATKITTTCTLSTGGWNVSTLQQAASTSGVTASNLVEVSPAPASWEAATAAGVYCLSQASGTLTFKCKSIPATNLTMNVVIWN